MTTTAIPLSDEHREIVHLVVKDLAVDRGDNVYSICIVAGHGTEDLLKAVLIEGGYANNAVLLTGTSSLAHINNNVMIQWIHKASTATGTFANSIYVDSLFRADEWFIREFQEAIVGGHIKN
jgi:hypothetical protein